MEYKRVETFDIAPQESVYREPEEFVITPATKEAEEASATIETDEEPDKPGKWYFMPLFLVFVGVLALALVQAVLAVHATFAASPVIGAIYAAIAVLIVYALCSVIVKEFLLLLHLKKAETLRANAAEAVKKEDKAELTRICQSLPVNKRKGTKAEYNGWLAEKESLGTAKEVFIRYSNRVLAIADKEAGKVIAGHSLKAAAFVAISPLALGDMVLVLMNSRRMLDKIADCYGVRLGFASRIKLYRQVMQNMVIAAGADVLLGSISTGIAGAVAPKIGEGLLSGFFSARLGISAANICRPLPRQDGDKMPGYADLCGQIKNSFMKKNPIDNLGGVAMSK